MGRRATIKDTGSIPGSGRSPGEGNGNPLQYSCLRNPMDRGAWWAVVPGAPEPDSTEGSKALVSNYGWILFPEILVLGWVCEHALVKTPT